MRSRWITAASGTPPTPEQRAAVAELQDHVARLAAKIERHVPPGPNRDEALLRLEDVQMRANRGIFADAPEPAS